MLQLSRSTIFLFIYISCNFFHLTYFNLYIIILEIKISFVMFHSLKYACISQPHKNQTYGRTPVRTWVGLGMSRSFLRAVYSSQFSNSVNTSNIDTYSTSNSSSKHSLNNHHHGQIDRIFSKNSTTFPIGSSTKR